MALQPDYFIKYVKDYQTICPTSGSRIKLTKNLTVLTEKYTYSPAVTAGVNGAW